MKIQTSIQFMLSVISEFVKKSRTNKEIARQNTSKIVNLPPDILQRIFTGTLLLFAYMLLSGVSFAQITLTDIHDTYVDNAAPTSNFGSSTLLKVSYSQVTKGQTLTFNYQDAVVEFDKSTLPTNLSANDVVRATLKLYVNKVNTPATSGVATYRTCNTYDESTVTFDSQPINCPSNLATAVVYSQAITTATQYVTLNVKPIIVEILNNGNSTFTFRFTLSNGNVVFDSKESGGNPPVLELELLKINSITGTDGLTGGGNNGNLLLSIADAGVSVQKLANGAVTSPKIANGAVGNLQLANNSVNTNNIVTGAINNLQLADNSITANKISPGAITENQLSNGSVNDTKLADNSVTANKISAGAVTDTKLADNSVTNSKLLDNSVTTNKINTGAVTTNQLGDSSVTEAKLADNSVSGLKLANNSVTNAKIANGAITDTKLADGSVTNAKIADGAINGAKIALNSVGTTQIANGAVGNNQLGANAVTSDKIASGQVVKTVNGITDNVNLIAGNNITITPSGNSLTISATGGTNSAPQTPSYNPQQLALKRWYSVNNSGASVTVGNTPQGIAFDGGNIWVSNAGDNTVSKIRASDGTVLGTFPVGPEPRMVEFDGSNIWVANFGGNTVTKLRASDGQLLATITVANRPWGLAFDGTNMWVSCYASSLVYRLRVSDGNTLGTVSANNPLGLAFDGTNIWAVNNLGGGQVTKYRVPARLV